MDNKVIFDIGAYDTELLLPQLAAALKARTERLSRIKMPGLWKASDKLGAGAKSGSKTGGVLLVVLGIGLMVPGLMHPTELLLPLLAGILALGMGSSRILQRDTERRFRRSAAVLLTGKDQPPKQPQTLVFGPDGMTMPENVGGELVPYRDFELSVFCRDLVLVVFRQRAVVLQKKDMTAGSQQQLLELLRHGEVAVVELN